jgi:alcohol dehydrogenase class IV
LLLRKLKQANDQVMGTLPLFENHLPRRVLFGRGRVTELVEVCRENGWKRIFVVTDEGVTKARLVTPVLEMLSAAKLLAGSSSAVPPEPELQIVDRIAEQCLECRADVLVGIGGGSVMDATKVAAIVAKHQRIASSYCGIGKVPKRGLPTILVPTTAGTGSEATFVAILTDPVSGNKVGVVSPHLLADIAVVDPSLTDRLPSSITAATGMDAMVHALEALIAKVATPLARGLALQAARYLGPYVERAVERGSDVDARDAMAIGSHHAGMAFANSSCCAVHALALPLGGRYAIPHGVITGCFFGELMRHNASVCTEDILRFSEALGWKHRTVSEVCDAFDGLAQRLGLTSAIRKVRVSVGDLSEMAQAACGNQRLMGPNPVTLTEPQVVAIYRKVLEVDERTT